MAKSSIQGLSQQEQDILNLDTAAVMKKYNMGKQSVYDKRYALKKRLAPADSSGNEPEAATKAKKKPGPRKGTKRSAKLTEPQTSISEQVEKSSETVESASADLIVLSKQVPVIHKPIEINFENFSVKLNGVPKKISVNPETNAIEIDL